MLGRRDKVSTYTTDADMHSEGNRWTRFAPWHRKTNISLAPPVLIGGQAAGNSGDVRYFSQDVRSSFSIAEII